MDPLLHKVPTYKLCTWTVEKKIAVDNGKIHGLSSYSRGNERLLQTESVEEKTGRPLTFFRYKIFPPFPPALLARFFNALNCRLVFVLSSKVHKNQTHRIYSKPSCFKTIYSFILSLTYCILLCQYLL